LVRERERSRRAAQELRRKTLSAVGFANPAYETTEMVANPLHRNNSTARADGDGSDAPQALQANAAYEAHVAGTSQQRSAAAAAGNQDAARGGPEGSPRTSVAADPTYSGYAGVLTTADAAPAAGELRAFHGGVWLPR